MAYKEICSLCKGNGYITVVVEEKDETKQCWLCESNGERISINANFKFD